MSASLIAPIERAWLRLDLPGARWLASGVVLAASMLSILYGLANSVGALVLLAWLGMPGVVYSLRSHRSATGLAVGLASGWAASLVVAALLGSLIGHFHWSWVLGTPLFLSLLAFRVSATDAEDTSPTKPAGSDGWLAASMLVGLAFAWPALSHVGVITETGVNFRPFFNADFFKHVGIAQGFLLGEFPPRDLFGHGGSVQYYWLQHVIPATLLALLPGQPDPFRVLGAIGGWQTVVLSTLLYLWARRFSGRGDVAFLVVLVATASLSLDGLASFLASGRWLEPANNFNMEPMDVTTSLFLTADRIHASTLYRLNLYIPQHQLCAIFIVAWFLALPDGYEMDSSRLMRAALIIAMPAASLLMGLPALGIITSGLALRWLQDRSLPKIELAGIAMAVVLPFLTGMISLDSSVVRLSTSPLPISTEPTWTRLLWLPVQLLTSFGVMLPLAAIGARVAWQAKGRSNPSYLAPVQGMWLGILGYAVSIVALPPTFLLIDTQLKLSFVLGIMLVPLGALAISSGWLEGKRSWRVALGVLFVLGLPSPIHDARWHSCETVECRTTAWKSTTIPTADWQALLWIREHTDRSAVFQQFPEPDFLAGGRDVWIPVVAGRQLYASRRGSHVSEADIAIAGRLFDPDVAGLKSGAARNLGIEYLYLSRTLQGPSFQPLVDRFSADPDMEPVFSNGDVSIWRVGNRK